MEIKPYRMISLGYGRFWRSDAIVGLMRIEDERGPRRRTEVYTATLDEPIVASRSEGSILQDMAYASDEYLRLQETREIVGELAEAEGHHPDISFGWGYCTVVFYTHKIKGLHENDFIMAAKVNELV